MSKQIWLSFARAMMCLDVVEMDYHMELKSVACIQPEIRFLFLVETHMHTCVLALIILSLYIDCKHCAACSPSAGIQTIHSDRHATIQTACQLFKLQAFSDWLCSEKRISIWI